MAAIGCPEVRRSLVAAGGGAFRLPQHMPDHFAMEIALTGKTALAAAARIMRAARGWSGEGAWEWRAPLIDAVRHAEDRAEGLLAFAEKRASVWKGR